jgi:hypothetical protein
MSLFVGVAALTALLFPAMSAAQQCIPSCDEKDGRTLAITNGAGLSTLTDLTLDISVRANAQEAFFLLGFFDGQTGGLWDLKNPAAAPQQNFSLFADPLGDGTCGGDGCDGADMITLFDGEAMPDNAWFDENVANDIRALNGDGSLYIYLLRAELGGTLTPPVRNSFKVRTGVPEQASIEVFQQPFAFNAAMPTFKELEIIYPGCAGLGLADTPPDFSTAPSASSSNRSSRSASSSSGTAISTTAGSTRPTSMSTTATRPPASPAYRPGPASIRRSPATRPSTGWPGSAPTRRCRWSTSRTRRWGSARAAPGTAGLASAVPSTRAATRIPSRIPPPNRS